MTREDVTLKVRELSRGRCEVVAYHKVYALTEAAALEIADLLISRPEAERAEGEAVEFAGWQRRLRSITAAKDHPHAQWSSWKECSDFQAQEAIATGGANGFPEIEAEARKVYALSRPQPVAETVEAREFIENWFAPWGSWKTAWWEMAVSDDVEMTDANALKALRKILAALRPSAHGVAG